MTDQQTGLAQEFINLVDKFILNCTEPDILDEIKQVDDEARSMGISFYDMYCVVLQNVLGHEGLVSKFRYYMRNKDDKS